MNQYGHARFFTSFENREETLFVQIFIVDIRPDLYPFQTDLLASLQLPDRQFSVLHGKRTQPYVLLGILIGEASNVVIEEPRKFKSVHRLCPVRKHDRD